MSNSNQEYYYFDNQKVTLYRLPDSFAVRYKEQLSFRALEQRMINMPDFGNLEGCSNIPSQCLAIITLPPTKRLADIEVSLRSLESDNEVEFVVPVYREPQSELRLIVTDEITVRFKNNVHQSEIEKLNSESDVEVIEQNNFVPNQYLLRIKDPKDTLNLANKYHESNLTEFAAPNFVSEFKKYSLPNDIFFAEQWYLRNDGQGNGLVGEDVDAEDAWRLTQGSPNITIAILDDGVDIEHPDLKANIWKNPNSDEPDVHGRNFYDANFDPRPRKFTFPYTQLDNNDSHGTPCAGVVAAVGENQLGVIGIAYKCKILPVKIFLADDPAPVNALADAIRYAGQRADVLSCSWGIPFSTDVEYAIKDVVNSFGRVGRGCPVFCATGNEYQSKIRFPASIPAAIAVGASTNLGLRANYSNYGEGIDFVAPSSGGTKRVFTTDVSITGRGLNIGSTTSGDAEGLYTNNFGGTSSATPLAAGIAALILSLNPKLTWDQVRKYMRDTADKIDFTSGNYLDGYSIQYGFGRVNAYKALQAVKSDMENTQPQPDEPCVQPDEPSAQPNELIARTITPMVSIPDRNLDGIVSAINIDKDGEVSVVEEISVDISHSHRADLLVSLICPDQTTIKLHRGQGNGAEDLIETYDSTKIPELQQLIGRKILGQWSLKIIDRWSPDTGTLNKWGLKIRAR